MKLELFELMRITHIVSFFFKLTYSKITKKNDKN